MNDDNRETFCRHTARAEEAADRKNRSADMSNEDNTSFVGRYHTLTTLASTSSQHNNIQKHPIEQPVLPHKNLRWRRLVNLFTDRSSRIHSEGCTSDGQPSGMRINNHEINDSRDSATTIDIKVSAKIQEEENSDGSEEKWLLWKVIAFVLVASVIVICVRIGVAIPTMGKDRGLSPEDIQQHHEYNQWFCLFEAGPNKICYGLTCIGMSCSECGIYEVNRDTDKVTGECSHCSVCAEGGISADCTNIGYGTFSCDYGNDARFVPEGYKNYTFWDCNYLVGDTALCLGYTDCNSYNLHITKFWCSTCGMYKVQVDTNKVVGTCSYCNVCEGAGVDADCSNIGYPKFNCH